MDINKFKTATEMKKMTEEVLSRQIDMNKKVEAQLKHVFEFIESSASKGRKEVSAILLQEAKHQEEIYRKVADVLEEKGYQIKLHINTDDKTGNYVKISWEYA